MVRKKLKAVLILAGWSFLLASCAQERPVQISQTSAHNLLKISDYQDQEYDLTTEGSIHSGASFTDANQVKVEKTAQGVNNFGLVSYKTQSPHFDGVPFFGKSNANYKLKYEVTNDYLVISKLSEKSQLPFQEMTYATSIGKDLYKVPMVGYPVTLFKLVRRKNYNNEQTHELDKVRVYSLKEATHFDINFRARKTFDAVSKNNVFKSDFLDGEWFYAATVISASPDMADSIGRDLSMDFKAREVSRIRFSKRKDAIVGLNLNIDENIDKKDDINLEETINIPSKYFDYRQDKSGNDPLLREVAIGDDHEERRSFKERDYVKFDFSRVNSALTRGMGALDRGQAILDSLEIAENYFAFVVYYHSDEVRIRYAFRKAHKAKAGRVYFKDDRKLFGFFSARKFAIINHRYERKEDQERLNLLNRFYPNDGVIRYYFSKQTPEHMKEAARVSIKVWDKAFQKAGTGLRVVLDESQAVNLGDIRYNIINIVDTKDGANLLGYGPSIVDSFSGEIISATSNIYANPFRENWIEILRNYVRSQLGLFSVDQVGAPSLKMTQYPGAMDKWLWKSQTHNGQKETSSFLNFEKLQKLRKQGLQEGTANLKSRNLKEGMFHYSPFDRSHKDMIEQIREKCGDSIDSYIQEIKEEQVTHNRNELVVLNKCADILLQDSVIATLVHELGHNFGLRHNFIASTDKANFTKGADGKILAGSSSVMDYNSGKVRELLEPGAYDVAAIRFGYGNKVLLKDGSHAEIKIEKSLAQQIEDRSLDVVKFKFCTDEDVQRTNPLCQMFDDGENPLAVAKNTIESFYSSYTVYGQRYDRAGGATGERFGMSHLSRTFFPLKKIYDQWRFHLREFVGEKDQYLEDLSKEEFEQVLEKMKSSDRYGRFYKDYYQATQVIYDFFKRIVFTPARVCAAESTDLRFFDFEEIKEDVFKSSGLTVDSCDHPSVVKELKARGLNYKGQFGAFYKDQKETLDIADEDHRLVNAAGFETIRRAALLTLTGRFPTMEHLAVSGFTPNFLDNPIYRQEILAQMQDRVFQGVNGESFGFTSAPLSRLVFSREKELIQNIFVEVVAGLSIPGNFEESTLRRVQFAPNTAQDPRRIPENAVVTTFRYTHIFTDAQPGTPVRLLIEKREELAQALAQMDVPIPELPQDIGQKAYEALKQAGLLKTVAELGDDQFSVKDFVDYLNKVQEFVTATQEKDENVATVAGTHFASWLATFGQIAPALAANEEFKPLLDGPLKALFADKRLQFSITFEQFTSSIAEESFVESVKVTVNAVNSMKAKADESKPYRDELEAQKDIITQILLAL